MIGWGGSKIYRLKFNSLFSTNEDFIGKKIQFEKKKFKIKYLKTQLDFVEDLIEYGGLNFKKQWFFKSI